MKGQFRIWEQAPGNEEAVRLELGFDDRRLATTAQDGFFEALASLRRELEPAGYRLECYGCSRSVYPSPMIRSMGYGEKAYRLAMGRPTSSGDLVSIFDTGPDIEPATLAEQEQYYKDWLGSMTEG